MSWDTVKLGDILIDISYGYTASADFSIADNKLLRITDITEKGVDWSCVPGCKSDDDLSKYILRDGDIVIARTGGTIGKSFLIENPPANAIYASYLICLSFQKDVVYPKYINCFFGSDDYWQQLYSAAQGTGQPNVNTISLKNLVIPLPPLDEQRRIAAEIERQLAAVEKAKHAAMEQLAAAQALNAAYLREVFTCIEGEQTKLGDVCIFEGGSQPPKTTFKYSPQEGYIRLIQIQDYRREDMAVYIPIELARRFCKKDDVMIGRYGPPVFQILRGLDGAYNVALMKAYPKDNEVLDTGFLFYLLQEESIQSAVINQSQRSAGQTGVVKDFIEKLDIDLPDIDRQHRLVTEIELHKVASQKTVAAIQAQLETINAMPAAILRQAFSGQM